MVGFCGFYCIIVWQDCKHDHQDPGPQHCDLAAATRNVEIGRWYCRRSGHPDEALEEIDPLNIITQRSDLFILKDSVVVHIQDQGSWARDLYNTLSETEKQTTLNEITAIHVTKLLGIIGGGGISIVANVSQVQADQDSNDNTRKLETTPVITAHLIKIRPTAFI